MKEIPHTILTIELNKRGTKLIEGLMKKTAIQSPQELVQHAFACHEMMIDHQLKGGKVILRNADGSEDIVTIK